MQSEPRGEPFPAWELAEVSVASPAELSFPKCSLPGMHLGKWLCSLASLCAMESLLAARSALGVPEEFSG